MRRKTKPARRPRLLFKHQDGSVEEYPLYEIAAPRGSVVEMHFVEDPAANAEPVLKRFYQASELDPTQDMPPEMRQLHRMADEEGGDDDELTAAAMIDDQEMVQYRIAKLLRAELPGMTNEKLKELAARIYAVVYEPED